MTPRQAELLLRLVENRHDEGTDLITQVRQSMGTHAQHLLDDEAMLIKALDINRQDQERFANYMPQRPQTLHQALQQGPRAALTGGKNEAAAQGQRPERSNPGGQ
jgi:hypothetical protein